MWELDVRSGDGPIARAVVGAGARIGRAPTCDLVLPHPSVSRVHARVEERDGRLWLVDSGSRNGLRIGDRRVPAVRFAPHLAFFIGDLAVTVERVAAARLDGGDLEFAEDVHALLERTAFRAAEGPLLEEQALEDPAGIELAAAAPAPAPAAAASVAPSTRDERRARLVAGTTRAREGALGGDLGQQPFAVRLLAWVLVPLALAGSAALAYALVRMLRG